MDVTSVAAALAGAQARLRMLKLGTADDAAASRLLGAGQGSAGQVASGGQSTST